MSEPSPFTFVARGHPVTKGSKKGFVNPRTKRVVIIDEMTKALKLWEKQLLAAAETAWGAFRDPSDQPVALWLVFYFERPLSHYRTGKFHRVLKGRAPDLPATRVGDVDKLSRTVLDVLEGLVYRDDSQVCALSACKRYVDRYEEEEGCSVAASFSAAASSPSLFSVSRG